jgi:hypothetical protein
MYTRPYTDNDQPASTAHPPPLTPPSLVGSQSTPPRSRGSTSRHVHRPRASYTPTAHQHRHSVLAFPRTTKSSPGNRSRQARTTGVLRVTSAPTPSYECRHVSYTLQQLKARFSEREAVCGERARARGHTLTGLDELRQGVGAIQGGHRSGGSEREGCCRGPAKQYDRAAGTTARRGVGRAEHVVVARIRILRPFIRGSSLGSGRRDSKHTRLGDCCTRPADLLQASKQVSCK